MRMGAANIRELLDRALCNQSFVHHFDRTLVIHLARTISDHNLILVKSQVENIITRLGRPFKILNAWFTDLGFEELVKDSWTVGKLATEAMLHFKEVVQHWNMYTFGNTFERKRRCHARINGIQRERSKRGSSYLDKLEKELLQEMNKILEHEEFL